MEKQIQPGYTVPMVLNGTTVFLTEKDDPNKCKNCIFTGQRDLANCPKFNYGFKTKFLCQVLEHDDLFHFKAAMPE